MYHQVLVILSVAGFEALATAQINRRRVESDVISLTLRQGVGTISVDGFSCSVTPDLPLTSFIDRRQKLIIGVCRSAEGTLENFSVLGVK